MMSFEKGTELKKTVLDVCCGGRMFYFDKNDSRVTFMDNRALDTILCDGRHFEVRPDIIGDFTAIPFPDNTYHLVVFDPPTCCTTIPRLQATSR